LTLENWKYIKNGRVWGNYIFFYILILFPIHNSALHIGTTVYIYYHYQFKLKTFGQEAYIINFNLLWNLPYCSLYWSIKTSNIEYKYFKDKELKVAVLIRIDMEDWKINLDSRYFCSQRKEILFLWHHNPQRHGNFSPLTIRGSWVGPGRRPLGSRNFFRPIPEGSLSQLASAPGGTYGVFIRGLQALRARGPVPPCRSATVRPHKYFSYFW